MDSARLARLLTVLAELRQQVASLDDVSSTDFALGEAMGLRYAIERLAEALDTQAHRVTAPPQPAGPRGLNELQTIVLANVLDRIDGGAR